jgi:uncharacterized membrane protein
MRAVLWRVLIAIVVVAVVFWLLPPVLRLLGLPAPGGDFAVVLHAVVGLLALLYIIWGPTPPTPWA